MTGRGGGELPELGIDLPGDHVNSAVLRSIFMACSVGRSFRL